MMEHEAGERLEEDGPAAERPSLTERLLGVTTMEDELDTAGTSTSARGLIERLTAAGRRPPEKRVTAQPKRPPEKTKSDEEATHRRVDDIPVDLRASDAFSVLDDPLAVGDALHSPAGRALEVEGLPPDARERRPMMKDLPPTFAGKSPVVNNRPPVYEDKRPVQGTAAKSAGPSSNARRAPNPDSAAGEPDRAQRGVELSRTPAVQGLANLPHLAGPGPLESSLNEANNLVRLRYQVLLASVAFVFGLAIVSGIAMLGALVANAEWQVLAIIGALEAAALLALVAILVFLQNEPSVHSAPTSTEIAQLETARAYLNKSFEFWEKYLNEREGNRSITAEDVAIAVSSLTAASHGLLDLEAGLAALASAKFKRPTSEQPSPASTPSTRPTVRSRPSRY